MLSFLINSVFDPSSPPHTSDVRFFLWTRYFVQFNNRRLTLISLIFDVWLLSRSNPLVPIQLHTNRSDILHSSTFNLKNELKVIIHGFGGNGTTDLFVSRTRAGTFAVSQVIRSYRNESVALLAYLKLGAFNVISVDWSTLSAYPNYARAALCTTLVGVYVSQFLDFLIENGLRSQQVHLIGYSLGAHVSGSAGHSLKSGRLKRITGTDIQQ